MIAPVVSEKSYGPDRGAQVRVPRASDAHKTQIRQAVEELFGGQSRP